MVMGSMCMCPTAVVTSPVKKEGCLKFTWLARWRLSPKWTGLQDSRAKAPPLRLSMGSWGVNSQTLIVPVQLFLGCYLRLNIPKLENYKKEW